MTPSQTTQLHSAKPSSRVGVCAFTLVEVVIAAALAVIIMLGVNQIFKSTSDTIGAAQSISDATRDAQAAHAVLANDFAGAVTSGSPFIVLQSEYNAGLTANPVYLNRQQEQAGVSGNFRTDRFCFYSRNFFRRQTGTSPAFISSLTSNEAWISLSHLRIANKQNASVSADFSYPGDTSLAPNPNNYYACNWVLGRSAILLLPPSSISEAYLDVNTGAAIKIPVTVNTKATTGELVQSSRYDLGGSTIDTDRTNLSDYITANPTNSWWNNYTYRFWCDPYPVRPLDSAKAARTTPYFLAHCSQFIVEFAGDFDGDSRIDTNTVGSVQKIRWYGLQRLNADGTVAANTLSSYGVPASSRVCERTSTTGTYLCAWGPDTDAVGCPLPKMIRIILTIEDPNGRLAEGKTFEYVFQLP